MADTVGDLISDCQQHLLGMHRGKYDRVGGSGIDADDTDVTLEFGNTGVQAGMYLAIEDELVYVWAWNSTSKIATIQRGLLGSEGAAHALGALVEVNPRYFRFQIRREIGKEIRSWSPRLYAVVTEELNINSGLRAVDLSALSAEPLHVLDVLRGAFSGYDSLPAVRYRWERSINKLFLEEITEGTTLTITYARDFDTSTMTDGTEITDLLLSQDCIDIVPYGVAWRIVSSREIGRAEMDAQAEPRDSAEVPPGHIIQTSRQMKAMRDERIAEAARLLRHKWGVRISA